MGAFVLTALYRFLATASLPNDKPSTWPTRSHSNPIRLADGRPIFRTRRMYWIALPLALLPAALHWWWTRWIFEPSASAVLPERHLHVTQRVSFVTMTCTAVIVMTTGWQAVWILAVQLVTLTASTYRARRAMFGETWPFHRYLSWRMRFHAGLFGLWWFVALSAALLAQTGDQAAWWLAGLTTALALAWHHWSARVLLVLVRASRLERPDLDGHFQRVFAAARVPRPDLWRAGAAGGRLANAFAIVTLGQRGVLFFDSLLDQLTPDEITAILAHEVAHLEQFHRQRLLGTYAVTTTLILLLMIGSGVAGTVVPGFESWVWILSFVGVLAAMWLRARRMQGHETDADVRAIELCGDSEALIRALTRIYAINHIPRRWSAVLEERATHPSLARRIRTIRDRTAVTQAAPEPFERLLVTSLERGRCALIDENRIAFLWIDDELGDPATILDRAGRIEIISYDQLGELRLSAKRGVIELLAVGHHARRWSMPIGEEVAARVQAALDRVDHLVAAPLTRRDLGIAQRAAALLVILLAAPYNAIGAVLAPALLAVRRPKRPMMIALAVAVGGTAAASVNELDAGVVRVALLGILTLVVLWSVPHPRQQETPDVPLWAWLERLGLLVPVVIGVIVVAANARDLFGLHSAVRDRSWFPAALAAMAVFYVVERGQRTARRAGLSLAVLATASLVVGSPWFLLHAVADPLVAEMPSFGETAVPATALAGRSFNGEFNAVDVTPDGRQFVLSGEYDQDAVSAEDAGDPGPHPQRFIAGGFDGWSREIHAFDVAIIDDERLLVVDRLPRSSRLRAENLRSGDTLWTIELPDVDVFTVQAATDGRWRAFARRGRRFDRVEGRVGSPAPISSTRWTVTADTRSYVDMPRNDGGSVALALAPLWEEPALSSLLTDWRQTTQLLRVDSARTTELATSHLRVECPAPPIDVTGYVCLSFDGRWSRIWRIDVRGNALVPIGAIRHTIWNPWLASKQRLAGVASGRPVLADLDSKTLIALIPDKYCWMQDVAVAPNVLVGICGDRGGTTVTQYRLPAEFQ
jgi:Zn-dependent protease with chaperone function